MANKLEQSGQFMQEEKQLSAQLRVSIIIIGGFILIIWGIEILDYLLFRGALDSYGIQPRAIDGLWGILWAPFLHGGFGHLLANTGPLLVMGLILLASRPLPQFFTLSGLIVIISGLGTWLIGPRFSVHIGASGLVFGYFAFLLLSAYFERSCRNILIAVLVLFLYSGIIWGVLPQANGISWQTHLFGFIGGGFAAYLFAQRDDGIGIDNGISIKVGDEIDS
jgi:membrane associated rhomboid family serine protease